MKILYVSTISNTVNSFLIPHIRMLIDQGHQVDVAFNIVQDVSPEIATMGCAVHAIEFQRSPLHKQNYIAYKKLKQLIQSKEYNLVHAHTPVASVCARLACRKMQHVKMVYTVHGFHFYHGAPLMNWLLYYPLERNLAGLTDTLVTINGEDYDLAVSHKFKAKSIQHVHGVGIDTNKYRPVSDSEKMGIREKKGYSREQFILFYAAEFNKNKNQEFLIRSLFVLKKLIPNIKMILAGKGTLEGHCKRLAIELGLIEEVEFVGYRTDIVDLITLSDLVVASSLREGLPVNVLEAMACGKPVLASNNRGHRELIVNNKNGYIFDIGDIEQFAIYAKEIYSNRKSTTKEFGAYSVSLIQKYALSEVRKELTLMYERYS